MKIQELKSIDWQHLVTRREAFLFQSLVSGGYQYFSRVTGIRWRPRVELRLGGELYYSGTALQQLQAIFETGAPKIFTTFQQRLLTVVRSLDTLATHLESLNYAKLPQGKLERLARQYIRAVLYATNFLATVPIAGKVISQFILDLLPPASSKQKEQWLYTLTAPTKENAHTKETRSFLKIAQAYVKNHNHLNQLISRHTRRYGWIGARAFWWDEAWMERDIQERLKSFFASRKDPVKELHYVETIPKRLHKQRQKLRRELRIKRHSRLYYLLMIGREYAFLRTWRTDTIYRSGYRVRNLFYEIATRAGLEKTDVLLLTYKEVLRMAVTGKSPISSLDLQQRKRAGKMYIVSVMLNGQYQVFSGKQWVAYFRKHLNLDSKAAHVPTDAIRGNTAFAGVVRGTVKVVRTVDDLRKVQRGDILVAVMTFPNYIPAMERAAAFVTDEGGILSHAAIVSRELKKPCVIGTKIATSVLQDGERVKVDATRGIVERI